MEGFQKKYLRGLAHNLKPVVLIGQRGLTDDLLKSAEQALQTHELIKVRFNDFKEKEQKEQISRTIEEKTGSELVGSIGHIYIFFRQHEDPEKRRIQLPYKEAV